MFIRVSSREKHSRTIQHVNVSTLNSSSAPSEDDYTCWTCPHNVWKAVELCACRLSWLVNIMRTSSVVQFIPSVSLTDLDSYMDEAKVVVIQKVLEGLRQSFVRCADQQKRLIIWSPANTKLTTFTHELITITQNTVSLTSTANIDHQSHVSTNELIQSSTFRWEVQCERWLQPSLKQSITHLFVLEKSFKRICKKKKND